MEAGGHVVPESPFCGLAHFGVSDFNRPGAAQRFGGVALGGGVGEDFAVNAPRLVVRGKGLVFVAAAEGGSQAFAEPDVERGFGDAALQEGFVDPCKAWLFGVDLAFDVLHLFYCGYDIGLGGGRGEPGDAAFCFAFAAVAEGCGGVEPDVFLPEFEHEHCDFGLVPGAFSEFFWIDHYCYG